MDINDNENRVKVTVEDAHTKYSGSHTHDKEAFDKEAFKRNAETFKANAQPYIEQAKPYLEQAKQAGITAGLAATHYGAKGLRALNKKLQELEEPKA